MQIIPVLDIKNGQTVHAVRGLRDQYQAVATPLCHSSDASQVIKCFIAIAEFNTIYIADLNAITAQGDNAKLIEKLLLEFPDITFWVDRGDRYPTLPAKYARNFIPIIGSEALLASNLEPLLSCELPFILSLDFSMDGRLGPKSIFYDASYWPKDVIIMTLARVGENKGPDFSKLNNFRLHYPNRNFIAAGGIRDCEDLIRLEKIGIRSALLASALHALKITAEDICRFTTCKKMPRSTGHYKYPSKIRLQPVFPKTKTY